MAGIAASCESTPRSPGPGERLTPGRRLRRADCARRVAPCTRLRPAGCRRDPPRERANVRMRLDGGREACLPQHQRQVGVGLSQSQSRAEPADEIQRRLAVKGRHGARSDDRGELLGLDRLQAFGHAEPLAAEAITHAGGQQPLLVAARPTPGARRRPAADRRIAPSAASAQPSVTWQPPANRCTNGAGHDARAALIVAVAEPRPSGATKRTSSFRS